MTLVARRSTDPRPASGSFGVDFNPVADRLRIVSNTGQDLRANVDTGATTVDGALAYADRRHQRRGDARTSSAPPTPTAIAGTTEHDALRHRLGPRRPGRPRTRRTRGTLNTVGALGVDTSADVGFDILAGSAQTAFATLQRRRRTGPVPDRPDDRRRDARRRRRRRHGRRSSAWPSPRTTTWSSGTTATARTRSTAASATTPSGSTARSAGDTFDASAGDGRPPAVPPDQPRPVLAGHRHDRGPAGQRPGRRRRTSPSTTWPGSTPSQRIVFNGGDGNDLLDASAARRRRSRSSPTAGRATTR